MAYDGRVMRLALERFDEDRRARSEEQERRRERVFARQPRLREIEGELRSTMSRIIAQALRQGQDPSEAVARIRDRKLSLQEETRRLLMSRGYEADYLDETPACPLCGDSGYQDGRMCRCLRAYYVEEQNRELSRLLELCQRYNVLTISDEIHQDIVFGCKNVSCLHFPQHFSRLIVLTSGSKTFNIAGLQNSFAIIPDEAMRQTFDAYVKTLRIKKGVSFGYIAAEAGFRDGGPWLDEMLTYLQGNYDLLKSTLTAALPQIHVEPLEGTYMVWVDLSAYVTPDHLVEVVQNQAHLAVDFGFWFWPKDQVPADDAHIRINIATSRGNVHTAAQQLIAAIKANH
mgnify:CR=1 FL=1